MGKALIGKRIGKGGIHRVPTVDKYLGKEVPRKRKTFSIPGKINNNFFKAHLDKGVKGIKDLEAQRRVVKKKPLWGRAGAKIFKGL